MKMTFPQRVEEARRLAILQLLEVAGGYEISEPLLALALRDTGLGVSTEALADDLRFLRSERLVDLGELADLLVARLTQRGLETAQGILRVAGVARPVPVRT